MNPKFHLYKKLIGDLKKESQENLRFNHNLKRQWPLIMNNGFLNKENSTSESLFYFKKSTD